MKRKKTLRVFIGIAILMALNYSFSESSCNWTVPQSPTS
jgi:hypothetical protein